MINARRITELLRSVCALRLASTSTSTALRTGLCAQLNEKDVGKQVSLCGWLKFKRMKGAFCVLTDKSGQVQLFASKKSAAAKQLDKLPLESVVRITGQVNLRPESQRKSDDPTGGIEIECREVQVLNACAEVLPFESTGKQFNEIDNEVVRMKYRYLDLRRPKYQRLLAARSRVVQSMRTYALGECHFTEIETPTLFRPTPGGAAEFAVPSSSMPRQFYSLPQSPQQFKQLLMVAGVDRYFQIARCYRDESISAERQPEFTQVDIEMSFADADDVMAFIEQLVVRSWPVEAKHPKPNAPFERMRYSDAMRLYGTDKPDLRFGLQLSDMTDRVKPISPSSSSYCYGFELDTPTVSTAFLARTLGHELRQAGQSPENLLVFVPTDYKFDDQEKQDAIICIKTDPRISGIAFACSGETLQKAQEMAGALRLIIARELERCGHNLRCDDHKFVWIYDFPLFEQSDESASGWATVHHPFTAPLKHQFDLLYEPDQIGSITGQHYDLVVDGCELGGGSVRIHNAVVQEHVLHQILAQSTHDMRHLLDALAMGAPPHAGFALGLDRYLSVVLGTNSIRDVIAFPKSIGGRDQMSQAPAVPDQATLDRYHISQCKMIYNSLYMGERLCWVDGREVCLAGDGYTGFRGFINEINSE